MFTATLLTIDKTWKRPKCPLMDKEVVVYIKHKEILPGATTGTDPEGIMLSERSQTNTALYKVTCMWNL